MKCFHRLILRHSFLILLLLGYFAQADSTCENLFGAQSQHPDYLQVKVVGSEKLTKLTRSNAPQAWAWFKNFVSQFIPENILHFEGMIEGDPHNSNYGPILVNEKVKWRSLDYDDAGKGPYILDFAKFLISVKSVNSKDKVKTSDLWVQYQRGIAGKDFKSPSKRIAEILKMSAGEFRDLEVAKASKFSNGNKLINDGKRSTLISDKNIFDTVWEVFTRYLTEGLQVLDIGGREKEGGGSGAVNGEGGALRFIALVKGKDGRNTLYELKQDSDSAIANYQPQSTTLQEVLNFHVIRDGSNDPNFQAVNVDINGDKRFVLRPKPLYFYDFANKANTTKQQDEFEALSLYNAWYKGYVVSLQKNAPQYLIALQADKKGLLLHGLKLMTWKYLDFLSKYLPEN